MADAALQVAQALEGDDRVSKVIYPGLASHPQHDLAMAQMGSGGTLVTFEVKGGKEAAFRFMNALEIAKISNNLGDAKTIATHPATTTHQRLPQEQKDALGITPGLIRLSVGLEDAGDLIADLRQALGQALGQA
jgi:O-succinylhomoserine sulfhydrylase